MKNERQKEEIINELVKAENACVNILTLFPDVLYEYFAFATAKYIEHFQNKDFDTASWKAGRCNYYVPHNLGGFRRTIKQLEDSLDDSNDD